MSEGLLHVLLVCRGEAPFEGMWAVPGGFKRPAETLDDAAKRELVEETGVDAASLLTQFGAYGDPERDPRMNVVTVAYLAVLRDVGAVAGGSDAAAAALIPALRAAGLPSSSGPDVRGPAAAQSTACIDEGDRLRPVRATGGPANRRGRTARAERGRNPRQDPRLDGQPERLRVPRRQAV